MMGLGNLIRRNSKLFFKDKAMFFYFAYNSDYIAHFIYNFSRKCLQAKLFIRNTYRL